MDGTPLVVIQYCTMLRPIGLLGGVGRVVGRLPHIDVVTSMRTRRMMRELKGALLTAALTSRTWARALNSAWVGWVLPVQTVEDKPFRIPAEDTSRGGSRAYHR